MIDFSQMTYENLMQDMLGRISDLYDKRDTSPIPTALGPAAWALEGFYTELDKVQRSAFIQSAVGSDLDDLAVIAGISRHPATAAVRLGVFNAPAPLGARFSAMNGTESINFYISSVENGQYRLTAETPGETGNEYAGPILPITAISGLTSAQITDILLPGADEETDESLRARIIAALNHRPFAGNVAAYRDKLLSMDGVGAVQIYPTWNGGGTVKCSILGADLLPASDALVHLVQETLDPVSVRGQGLGFAPIGARVTVTTPAAVTVHVSATLTLAPGTALGQVQPLADAAVAAYLAEVRRTWGQALNTLELSYAADVYLARVTGVLVGIPGVVNATGVQLNGAAADLRLEQSGSVQQTPVLGTVTLDA